MIAEKRTSPDTQEANLALAANHLQFSYSAGFPSGPDAQRVSMPSGM